MADNNKEVVKFLNDLFGLDFNSLQNLDDLIQEFQENCFKNECLIKESRLTTNEGLSEATKSCQQLLQRIENSKKDFASMLEKYEEYKSREEVNNIKSTFNECESLQKQQCLSEWTDKLHNLREKIDDALENVDLKAAVTQHQKLFELCTKIIPSNCVNAKKMFFDTSEYYYQKIKDILVRDIDGVMQVIKYPFPTGISSPVFNKKENTEAKIKDIVLTSVQLQSISLTDSYTQLAELLTMPMKKRFMFHFYGNKQTNNIEKPEWYFYKVINWIRDHKEFWKTYIQKILEENEHTVDIMNECVQLLLELCEEKLKSSINDVINDEYLFGHLIDEILRFHKELKEDIDFDSSVCLDVLYEQEVFQHWLDLEEKISKDMMMKLLEDSNQPWSLKYEGLENQGKGNSILHYIPRCIEDYMTFLSLMTARHKSLGNIPVQLKFLKVLTRCLNDFIIQLKDVATMEVINPSSSTFCSIINGVGYMKCVLEEWNDDPYFLMLLDHEKESGKENGVIETFVNKQDELESLKEEQIFSELITVLERFKSGLIESVIEYVELNLQDKLTAYKNEKWHGLSPLKDYVIPVLSTSGCDIMLILKEQMYDFQLILSPDVFQELWKGIARCLDKKIFAEVIFDSHFNEGGAAQFQFDMKNNLMMLWSEYTAKPAAYFKLVTESCTVLNLLPGSAVLLKELFQQSEEKCETIGEKEEFVRNAVEELSIKSLAYTQVKRLLSNRIDWPKIS